MSIHDETVTKLVMENEELRELNAELERKNANQKEWILRLQASNTIDKLFLELSQFTTATTKRELQLRELNAELLKVIEYVYHNGALSFKSTKMMEMVIAKTEKLK